MSEFTIKLNLDDLRQLFGGDDKPAIEFRNSIADKFAKEYLKSLINSEIGAKWQTLVREEVNRVIKDTILDDKPYAAAARQTFQAHYKNMIDITIDTEVTKAINDKVSEANKKIDLASTAAQTAIQKLRDTNIVEALAYSLEEKKIQELVRRSVADLLTTWSKQAFDQMMRQSDGQ